MTNELSIWAVVLRADPVVQATMAILVVASVMTWGIAIQKFVRLREANQKSARFLEAFWESSNMDEIYRITSSESASPVVQVFRAGYRELRAQTGDQPETMKTGLGTIASIQRAMRRASSTELGALENRVSILASVGTSAPFIGLFGTVWGILQAFQQIGATGSTSLSEVGPYIAEALIATAIGLAAAIPAVLFYNAVVGRVRGQVREMDHFASDFLNIVSRHYGS